MKYRPIMFSGPMIRAILRPHHAKTQTRRFSTSPIGNAQLGDRMWVRETFSNPNDQVTIYRANWREDAIARGMENVPIDDRDVRWKPAIHMPRAACRIFLEITDVRFEQLHDITNRDAEAEGIEPYAIYGGTAVSWMTSTGFTTTDPRYAFRDIWSKINGPASWDANPRVVAITFKRLESE